MKVSDFREPRRPPKRNGLKEYKMKASTPRRGSVLTGVLLTCLAVVCLMAAAGIYVVRNLRIESHDRPGGADVSIDTPAGHLSVHAHDDQSTLPADFPLYPGARARKDSGGGAVVEWNSNTGGRDKGFSVSAAEMVTNDPFDKVVDYYRAQLPHWLVVNEKHGHVRMELRDGGYKKIIGIHEEHDGTHIGVATVGEPASN
jgi:hypothetical protein